MLPVIGLLALLATVLVVLLVQARRALAAERATVVGLRGDLAGARTELEAITAARDEAVARGDAAEAARDEARRGRADAEAAARRDAVARRAAEGEVAETAALAARLIDDGAADPAALWALERARSERTWRHSVAAVAGAESPFTGAPDPLRVALDIEAAAVREEVGAVVDLLVELPAAVTPGASLAVLRVVQEQLAVAARRGEVTTVAVGAEGADVVVRVTPLDADGAPLPPDPIAVPPSRIDVDGHAVRLRDALAAVSSPG